MWTFRAALIASFGMCDTLFGWWYMLSTGTQTNFPNAAEVNIKSFYHNYPEGTIVFCREREKEHAIKQVFVRAVENKRCNDKD